MRLLVITGVSLLAGIGTLQAQGIGVAAHAGTLGLGADVAVGGPRVAVRAGANVFPFDIDLTASDLDYTVDLPSPQFTAMLDLYLVSALRVSGGMFASSNDIELVGELTQNVEIGGGTYTPADVGTLRGSIINNDTAPYIGIGFGNPATSPVGFFLDLGVAFQGTTRVTLTADGPIANLPQFQADLEAERQAAEDDLEFFQYYPVVSIGFSIRLAQFRR